MEEKHRIFCEFYDVYFKDNESALGKFNYSIGTAEILPSLNLYGHEIFQYSEIYPYGKSAFTYLMNNKNDFFFKNNTAQAIRGVVEFLSQTCRSTYGMDALASIRDKFVIQTLSGRNAKILK